MNLDGLTLAAVVAELSNELPGSRVQQIYHPEPGLITLELWVGRDRTLRVETGKNARVHLTTEEFNHPATPSAFCMLLRKYIKHGAIHQVAQPGLERILDLCIRHGEEYVLRVELLGKQTNVLLLRGEEILGALKALVGRRSFRPGEPYQPPPSQGKLDPLLMTQEEFFARLFGEVELAKVLLSNLDGLGPRLAKELALRAGLDPAQPAAPLSESQRAMLWAAAGELFEPVLRKEFRPCLYFREGRPFDVAPFPLKLYEGLVCESRESISEALDECARSQIQRDLFEREQKSLQALVSEKRAHMHGALERVKRDLEQARCYEQIKHEGDLLMANLYRMHKGLSEIEVEDFLDSTQKIIKLDPALGPIENAQKKFERYKKLKRAQKKLEARLTELHQELEYLESVWGHLEQAEGKAELSAIRGELIAEGYAPQRERHEEVHASPREFVIRGYRVWVGRSSKQNDELVRNAAREDLWLHARDRPGAYVIIKNPQSREIPPDVLHQAAQLAAYYSKGRDAGKVPVSYTRVKYLRKPRGARPGLVLMTHEEGTLVVVPKGDI